VSEIELSRSSSAHLSNASQLDATSALLRTLPKFDIQASFWGVGVKYGTQLEGFVEAMAAVQRGHAAKDSGESQNAARLGSYARREQEWANQSNTAAGEISVLFKQLRAAQIREAVAAREFENHKKQIAMAREVETFITDERAGKLTNQSLYTWLRRETRGLYFRTLDFATEVANKAQRAIQQEWMDVTIKYIQPSYADGHDGLLSADKLIFDLHRMEQDYHEKKPLELEITENVSLLQISPDALVKLKITGECELSIEESLFDRRTPGHYFRRLQSVRVTIPCVTGPYALIHCTLTLLKSSIRVNNQLVENEYKYEINKNIDDWFKSGPTVDASPSVVTSGAQNDAGQFAGSASNERYLPFEGHGAISTWKINLPSELRDFDYNSIADVILHLNYTARAGVEVKAVNRALNRHFNTKGTARLFSLRHEFSAVWANLQFDLENNKGESSVNLALQNEHFPYWTTGLSLKVSKIDFYVLTSESPTFTFKKDGDPKTLEVEKLGVSFKLTIGSDSLGEMTIPDKLSFDVLCPKKVSEIWFIVEWKVDS
jgi:hypothetical protein